MEKVMFKYIKAVMHYRLGALSKGARLHLAAVFCLVLPLTVFAQDQSLIASAFSIEVTDVQSLYNAVNRANKEGNTEILLAPGNYQLNKTINIQAAHISLLAKSKKPADTRLIGLGMRDSRQVENLINVNAKYFTLDGLTLSDAGNHLIQINGERDADFVVLRNCVLQDSFQQLVKVTASDKSQDSSDYGLVENCEFKFTRGIGPNYYIGGIDAHKAKGWVVKHNVFRNIASPGKRVAEHAIHFWNGASNIVVENNIIINCDRGIGFGLQGRPASGGAIIGNLIVHQDNNHPNADVGISLEQTPDTQVLDNRVFFANSYPNAIEYRFAETRGIVIADNQTNKPIRKRDGATALLIDNKRVRHLKDMVSERELAIIAQH
jgi:hypothetical protein